jgi:hypothetical protein
MSSTSPGAQREPVHPRERRDAGHRRARQVTGWSAAGGTALAVVFGVVFAGSSPPPAAAGAPDPDAASSSPEDSGADAVVPAPMPVLDAPAPVIDVSAPTVAPSTKHHRTLSPPDRAPQVAAPSPKRRHASSGAS